MEDTCGGGGEGGLCLQEGKGRWSTDHGLQTAWDGVHTEKGTWASSWMSLVNGDSDTVCETTNVSFIAGSVHSVKYFIRYL